MRILSLVTVLFVLTSCTSQKKEASIIENVTVEQFQKLINAEGAQLIDVRTTKEYSEGHLSNSRMIDFMGENFKKEAFTKLDKDQPVFVYCAAGGRSAKAAKVYKEAGFKKVYNMLGGFRAWSAKGFKIEK